MTLVEVPHAQITPTGARFDENLTLDEWADIGDRLGRQDSGLRWLIGDWMIYGNRRFGASAAIVAESSGLAIKTIANTVSVCTNIPQERRRLELSYTHHREVAYLDAEDQVRLLDTAVREQLTTLALRAVIREEADTLAIGSAPNDEPEAEPVEPVDAPAPKRPAGWSTSLTLRLQGDCPDQSVLDDGLARVSDALEQLLAVHGFHTTVAVER